MRIGGAIIAFLSISFFIAFLWAIIGGGGNSASAPLTNLPIGLPGVDSLPQWSGKERVNLLLLGTDQRPDERGQPSRTDTMLVVTIDPRNKTAGLLSIPRDLWASIPLGKQGGTLEGKITTAHFYGDLYKYPGGGIALAKKAVEQNLGINIQYAARVDFDSFERIIDTLGGVMVDVETPLKDDEYPTPDYGTKRIFIPAGLQHLNGEKALEYVRSRHQDSDFGRMKRQQQVILSIREKALQLNLLPVLPKLINDFKDAIVTDLSPVDMLALARLGKDIDHQKIVMRSIDTCCVAPILTIQGEEALLINKAQLGKVIKEIFSDSTDEKTKP
ncbi:MAG: LCP family protein [Chloroflexi bacterium]|nr:LCP family protein [Chloroflexota bacterium]